MPLPRRGGGQRRPLAQIARDQLPVPRPCRLSRPGEAVARQVHQVEGGEAEGVEERGLAGCCADPGQAGALHQRIQQARFAHVGPADEGDFREGRVEPDQRIGKGADELHAHPAEGVRRDRGRHSHPPAVRRYGDTAM